MSNEELQKMADERSVEINLAPIETIKCPQNGCKNIANVLTFGSDYISYCVVEEDGQPYFIHVMEFPEKTLNHLRSR